MRILYKHQVFKTEGHKWLHLENYIINQEIILETDACFFSEIKRKYVCSSKLRIFNALYALPVNLINLQKSTEFVMKHTLLTTSTLFKILHGITFIPF